MPKLYQIWPGNNRFLCGCCVSGPSREIGGIIFIDVCTIAIIIPFSIFVTKSNWEITPILPLSVYILLALTQIFLLLTACSNPGIIPRRPFLNPQIQKHRLLLSQQVNQALKRCQTCQILRPKRASHCSSCQNCVEVFDHHCGVVGNCIGQRNYRFFIMFLCSVTISIIMLIINMAIFIIKGQSSIDKTVIIIIVAAVGSIIGLPIIFFFLFHIYLMVTKNTTRQFIKKQYREEQESENLWCGIEQPIFDPFIQISQQQSNRISNQISNMRRPMPIPSAGQNKTTKDIIQI